MLKIEIVNDKTGNIHKANYDYRVYINNELMESGKIENHNRHTGYSGLIQELSGEVMVKDLEKKYNISIKDGTVG